MSPLFLRPSSPSVVPTVIIIFICSSCSSFSSPLFLCLGGPDVSRKRKSREKSGKGMRMRSCCYNLRNRKRERGKGNQTSKRHSYIFKAAAVVFYCPITLHKGKERSGTLERRRKWCVDGALLPLRFPSFCPEAFYDTLSPAAAPFLSFHLLPSAIRTPVVVLLFRFSWKVIERWWCSSEFN